LLTPLPSGRATVGKPAVIPSFNIDKYL